MQLNAAKATSSEAAGQLWSLLDENGRWPARESITRDNSRQGEQGKVKELSKPEELSLQSLKNFHCPQLAPGTTSMDSFLCFYGQRGFLTAVSKQTVWHKCPGKYKWVVLFPPCLTGGGGTHQLSAKTAF